MEIIAFVMMGCGGMLAAIMYLPTLLGLADALSGAHENDEFLKPACPLKPKTVMCCVLSAAALVIGGWILLGIARYYG